jgi:hypothetical protein
MHFEVQSIPEKLQKHTHSHMRSGDGVWVRMDKCVYGSRCVLEPGQQWKTGQHESQQRPRPIITNVVIEYAVPGNASPSVSCT